MEHRLGLHQYVQPHILSSWFLFDNLTILLYPQNY
jgi:hypothetical protein